MGSNRKKDVRTKKAKPVKAKRQLPTTESAGPESMLKELGVGQDASLQALSNHSTSRPLHWAAIMRLQQQQGNNYIQRYLKESGAAPSIQRALTDEEKAADLQSPRFAGDARLQAAYDNSPILSRGAKGEAVEKLQQALIDDGYVMPISTQNTGAPDGIFGQETYKTVRKFQRKYGLGVDGKVGRDTMGKLDELYASFKPPKEQPEIEASEEAIGTHIVDNMNKANDPDSYTPDSGIWYDHNYRAMHEEDPDNYPWDEDYRKGLANSTYFERIDWMDWRLKPGMSASEGIKAWLKGLTIAECLSTIVAIEIDALRAAIGDQKFDEQFGSTSKVVPEEQRLRIRTGRAGTPVENYIVNTESAASGEEGTFGNRPVKKGEWYYFYNHPKYLLKHPGGAFQGENAVFMDTNSAGEQLWSGLGVSNVTEDGMLEAMVDEYNSERTDADYRSLVMYHASPPITETGTNYKALYLKYLDRIEDPYRHDKKEYEDEITKENILNDSSYTIPGDDEARKGGFLPSSGYKLDVTKVKELREE